MANGVVFDNEDIDRNSIVDVVRKVTENIKNKLMIMVKEMNEFRD